MTLISHVNSFGALTGFDTGGGIAHIFKLSILEEAGITSLDRLPFSIRMMLESVLRGENGKQITRDDVAALAAYNPKTPPKIEVPYKPSRVLLQDFTGVPAVVDLAALRSAMARLGGDPKKINPHIPVDLVIDHSVQVDEFATKNAFMRNTQIEFERNKERYAFLRWGGEAFDNFRVVPPASGICHQVNLEYLATVARMNREHDKEFVFPDTLVGTDSHTTMIGGLGILGWGVGGIEAEAVMLGQPLYMLAPPVVGVELKGEMPPGVTATDLVLAVTEVLRERGVVGKFVEFLGTGLEQLSVPDRATIANMAPEYGATVGYFPVDDQTLTYLKQTGRSDEHVTLVERYYKEQGLFHSKDTPRPEFQETLEIELGSIQTSLAGPKRPQDRIELTALKKDWQASFTAPVEQNGFGRSDKELEVEVKVPLKGKDVHIGHGSVAIAAITSCTNTSNPSVMIAAGLLAQKAVEKGLKTKPWVKTSLAPGSTVVTDYLQATGLMPHLEQLGFHVVGYGCTTCIGNSGPLPEPVANAVGEHNLVLAGVLSGNRNFEGRINPHVRANYLASPPLVVAYALAGTVDRDLTKEPIGQDRDGKPVFLADIWPSNDEIQRLVVQAFSAKTFAKKYHNIEDGNDEWNAIEVTRGSLYDWDPKSTYIQEPPFFVDMAEGPDTITPIDGARVLVMVGDSTTTDHISPAGAIPEDSAAGRYLIARGVAQHDFNSFGSRRGNDRVMTRGTFGNIRLKNKLAPGTEGSYTTHLPSGEVTSIYDAAVRYQSAGTPTIVIGGKDYGMGSSRDWAAKGTLLLGVKAVLAESFERIHRSNLVGMGVLPLEFKKGESAQSLGLNGHEHFDIDVTERVKPGCTLKVKITDDTRHIRTIEMTCRLDTPVDIDYYKNGGILQTVLRSFLR